MSPTRLSRLGVAAAAGLTTLALTVAACGSSGSTGTSATTTEAPEDKMVPDAEVAAGLAATQATMTQLAANPSAATDQALDDLFNGWVGYEGTVKKNEVEMYLTFEDALAAFTKAGKAKDPAGMTAAAATFADTAKAYLAKHPLMRRVLGFAAVVVIALLATAGNARAADSGAVSRDEGIAKLQDTRRSIDRTLELIKAGQAEQAFEEARNGYLSHFELVEVPLRVADNHLTIEAEGKFAEIRQMIRSGAPVDEIHDQIIVLRGLMDDAERRLTDTGLGAPAIVTAQSFLILFREGFEVVLLLAVLLGYLEAAKAGQYMRPILGGVALAAVATVLTVLLMPTIFGLLPVGREVLEAITALLAVVVLFYVSFWLIARMEHKRWLEFVKARMWRAVSIGSAASLVLVGFTAVYREGFETALFYQALLTFGPGLGGYVALGIGLGVVALAVVVYGMFRLGRKMPIKVFMNTAVAFVMITSVAFLGNAVHTLQSADVIPYTVLEGWPRLPIFLAEATGYWATLQVVVAQFALAFVYIAGAIYVFVVKPRLARRAARPSTVAAAPQAA